MNALTKIEPHDLAGSDYESWIEIGRGLLRERNGLDWKVGEWARCGFERYGQQLTLSLLGGELGIEPKRLENVCNLVESYPPALRDPALSIDHYLRVKDLPQETALDLLKQASVSHWTPEETRVEVLKVKPTYQPPLIRDDPDHDALMLIVRGWNRAPRHVRQEFMEIARESDLGVIDA